MLSVMPVMMNMKMGTGQGDLAVQLGHLFEYT